MREREIRHTKAFPGALPLTRGGLLTVTFLDCFPFRRIEADGLVEKLCFPPSSWVLNHESVHSESGVGDRFDRPSRQSHSYSIIHHHTLHPSISPSIYHMSISISLQLITSLTISISQLISLFIYLYLSLPNPFPSPAMT